MHVRYPRNVRHQVPWGGLILLAAIRKRVFHTGFDAKISPPRLDVAKLSRNRPSVSQRSFTTAFISSNLNSNTSISFNPRGFKKLICFRKAYIRYSPEKDRKNRIILSGFRLQVLGNLYSVFF